MWTSIADLKYMFITVIVDYMPHQTKNIDKVVVCNGLDLTGDVPP
jgi:hypothetical protein